MAFWFWFAVALVGWVAVGAVVGSVVGRLLAGFEEPEGERALYVPEGFERVGQ